jgi:hypothetical protein
MMTERADELKAIMHDNGTFIQLPPLGSSTSLITIFGDNRVSVQRTIRAIMQLVRLLPFGSSQNAHASFRPVTSILLRSGYCPCSSTFSSHRQLSTLPKSPSSFSRFLRPREPRSFSRICASRCTAWRPKCAPPWPWCWSSTSSRSVICLRIVARPLADLSPQAFHHEIRFQIELANEHKEFISGKKNGKINKIMQTTNVKIKFETFNEHNFVIDIAGGDVAALNGLALLQEELPAEISFHVPESYHKRIIGVGGRSIQRIMKKYGVYVKFSNAEEFAALGGYGDNEDNVIARTPAKNTINLEHLKQSVMELVHPKVCSVSPCIAHLG